MKIYGTGTFTAPNCSRVIWDFADGPFDTVNPVLIQEAKRRGYSFSLLAVAPVVIKPKRTRKTTKVKKVKARK